MKTYVCDPRRNTECGKALCFERGGPCGITDRPEYAVRDFFGQPVEIIGEDDEAKGEQKRA